MTDRQTNNMNTVRAGGWIGTLNNPTEEERVALRTQQRWMRLCKGQDEVGESGTLHVQFLVLTDWVRLSTLKRWLQRAHFEPCRGAQHVTNAMNYVHKQDTAVEGTQFSFLYRGDREVISTNKVLVSLYRISMEFNSLQKRKILSGFSPDHDVDEVTLADIEPKQDRLYYTCMSIYLAENPEHVNLFGNRVLKELWLHCHSAIIAWYCKEEEERAAAAAAAADPPGLV